MKVYYIYIKTGKKGVQPLETILNSADDVEKTKTFLKEAKGAEVNVVEKDIETFDSYKNRYEFNIKKEQLRAAAMKKLTKEELAAITE